MRLPSAIGIALLGFIVSLCFSFLIFPSNAGPLNTNIDPDRFGQVAANIAAGNGFVYEPGGALILERTPLYALVAAGIFRLAGGFSLGAVQLVQAVLHGITSLLIYLICFHLYTQRRTAMIAQACFAFHPIALWYTARIWLETTYTLTLAVVIFTMLFLFQSPSNKRAIIAGACIGISCLTKAVLLLFPFLIFVLLMLKHRTAGLKAGILVIVTTAVVIAPWTIRNYSVSYRFIPVNTSLGFNLVQGEVIAGRWPELSGTTLQYWIEGKARVDSILNSSHVSWESAEGDHILTDAVLQRLRDHPLLFGRRVLANFSTLWYLSESGIKSFLFGLFQISLAALALLSFFRMEKSFRDRVMPIVAALLYFVSVNALIVGWGRYSMPLIPLLILLASPLIDKQFRRTYETRN